MSVPRELINLTTHSLFDVKTRQEFPPSGVVARVEYHRAHDTVDIEGFKNSISVSDTVYGDIVGLPKKKSETKIYVVSAVVLNALESRKADRPDVIAPGPKVTDSDGVQVGCNGFRRNG